jgi:GxxExxY protein
MDFQQNKTNFIFAELSFKINGCAFKVHNTLGGGQLEKTYQKSLAIELTNAGITFQEQKLIVVNYANVLVGKNIPDFIVDDKIIVEIKRTGRLLPLDFDQARRYLKATNKKLSLLIHFGKESVNIKRVVNL